MYVCIMMCVVHLCAPMYPQPCDFSEFWWGNLTKHDDSFRWNCIQGTAVWISLWITSSSIMTEGSCIWCLSQCLKRRGWKVQDGSLCQAEWHFSTDSFLLKPASLVSFGLTCLGLSKNDQTSNHWVSQFNHFSVECVVPFFSGTTLGKVLCQEKKGSKPLTLRIPKKG